MYVSIHFMPILTIKIQQCALERSKPLRDAWIRRLSTWDVEMLIFVDESAANEQTGHRKTGWGPIGLTPVEYRLMKRTKRWSVLPAYTVNGFITWEAKQDSYDKAAFNAFIESRVLPLCTPFPGPRSVLVMDNARIHISNVRWMVIEHI